MTSSPTLFDSNLLPFSDAFVPEADAVQLARKKGESLGSNPVSQGEGATLRFVATAIGAKNVVEVGTGTGVSTSWLLAGMGADGVLTSIDYESDRQSVARETLNATGIAPSRYRLISGRALDVLPRLTDGAYDLVLVDGDESEYGLCLEQALRLLRTGGVIAFRNPLLSGKVPDPAQRDDATTAARELVNRIQDSRTLVPVIIPFGEGMLLAVTG